MVEPTNNREQLILEMEQIIDWREKIESCKSQLANTVEPSKYVMETFQDFSESYDAHLDGINKKLSTLWNFGFPIVWFYAFYRAYFHTDLFPNGFVIGVIIFIVVIIAFFYIYINIDDLIKLPTSEVERNRRFSKYQDDKKVFEENELKKKTDNESNYNSLNAKLQSLKSNPPSTTIPPQYYVDADMLKQLVQYVRDYRASSFQDAINLYYREQQMAKIAKDAADAKRASNYAAYEASRAHDAISSVRNKDY